MPVILGCRRGAGDREAEPIEDSIISTDAMAEARGKSFIDKNYYDVQGYQWTAPHKSNEIQQYKYTTVTGERIGLTSALMKIVDYEIGWSNHEGMKANIGLEYFKDNPFTACVWNDGFETLDSIIWDYEEYDYVTLESYGIEGGKFYCSNLDDYVGQYFNATITNDFEFAIDFGLSIDFSNVSNELTMEIYAYLPDSYRAKILFKIKDSASEITCNVYNSAWVSIFSETTSLPDINVSGNTGISFKSGMVAFKFNGLNISSYTISGIGAGNSYISLFFDANTETGYESKIILDNFRFLSGCPEAP